MTRARLGRARRIVVKVGTGLLAPPSGGVHTRRFSQLARDISELMDDGREVVLVSSGAVGLGQRRLGQTKRPLTLPEKQAAAAIGQIALCRRYERSFSKNGYLVGQLLLTHAGLSNRERFLRARRTFLELLAKRVVPLVNENDSVATEELRFGDNDRLAALVVNASGAELLILLTDVDGLYDRPPHEGPGTRIPEVERVNKRLLALTGDRPGGNGGSGGMRSGSRRSKAVGSLRPCRRLRLSIPHVTRGTRRSRGGWASLRSDSSPTRRSSSSTATVSSSCPTCSMPTFSIRWSPRSTRPSPRSMPCSSRARTAVSPLLNPERSPSLPTWSLGRRSCGPSRLVRSSLECVTT